MPKYYTALTIGPIYKTLANARHTRELWAGSYTFSYLMKQILRKILEDTEIERTFYLPFVTIKELNVTCISGCRRFARPAYLRGVTGGSRKGARDCQ